MIIDCFAGGGGASVGIEMALGRPVDIAINHDPEAIKMHKVNHPKTLHLTEDIFKVDRQLLPTDVGSLRKLKNPQVQKPRKLIRIQPAYPFPHRVTGRGRPMTGRLSR